MARPHHAAVDLYWIPLGAGGRSVAFNGRVFEAIAAGLARRPRCDLYHSALVVTVDGARHTIELAPSPDDDVSARGVVASGPVGARWAGRLRLFRYELRCWRDGTIPDLAYAVGGPRRLSEDPELARRLLRSAAAVPTPIWGRDELGLGEMWNCNSVISWLVTSAGLPARQLRPPPHGRAPGWDAGIAAAQAYGVAGFHGSGLRSRRAVLAWIVRMERRLGAGSMRIDLTHNPQQGGVMRKFFKYGGLVASIVLIAFGVGAIYTGVDGRDRVQGDLAREQIVGTPDSTIPGQLVDTGAEAEAFANTIRKHTLEATGGQTYAEMPRFLDENGKPTQNEEAAAVDPKSGEPVANPARNIWINSTALQTALRPAYFAEGVATFAIVMGVAMLLSGIGFLILTLRVLREPAGEAKPAKQAAPRKQAFTALPHRRQTVGSRPPPRKGRGPSTRSEPERARDVADRVRRAPQALGLVRRDRRREHRFEAA